MRRIQMRTIDAELVIHCSFKTRVVTRDAFANTSLRLLRYPLLDHPFTSLLANGQSRA